MSDITPTRRTNEPPARDGVPLAGWPTVITAEEAVALQVALKQLQTALDAVVRDRDEARAEVERLRAALQFYADRNRYKSASVHMCGHSTGQSVLIDGGRKAREALEAKP